MTLTVWQCLLRLPAILVSELQANDIDHPLTARLAPELYKNGLRAGQPRAPRTRLHTAALEFPSFPRPLLQRPRFTPGSNVDPTRGLDKKAAVVAHNAWHQGLPSSHTVVYTDGSEQNDESGRRVGYGFVVFSNGAQLASGSGALHPETHVFDAEAVGALRGLEAAIRAAGFGDITVCVDSTSVIWGLRGDAAMSSQWAYIDFHEAARSYQGLGEVDVRWSPGHEGIPGNEIADRLADIGARDVVTGASENRPSASGVKSLLRTRKAAVAAEWYAKAKARESTALAEWKLPYSLQPHDEIGTAGITVIDAAALKALIMGRPRKPKRRTAGLSRPLLSRFLAMRHGHGDFAAYHRRFGHQDASLECHRCGRDKTPDHLVHCPQMRALWRVWPEGPKRPPDRAARLSYLHTALSSPRMFEKYVKATKCFDSRGSRA